MLDKLQKVWNWVKVKVDAVRAAMKACVATVVTAAAWVKTWLDRIDASLRYFVPRAMYVILALICLAASVASGVKFPLAAVWPLVATSVLYAAMAAAAFYGAWLIGKHHFGYFSTGGNA